MGSEDDLWRWMGALSGATTAHEVAVGVAEVGADAANASFANLGRLDPETNLVRMVHGSSLDSGIAERWAEFPLSTPTPLCTAMLTRTPVLLGSPEAIYQHYPDLLADTLAASLAATASLPIYAANGETLGAVGFAWQHPQTFAEEQVHRLDLIARLAAQALDRAVLYEQLSPSTTGPQPTLESVTTTDQLTQRERAVLELLAIGYTNVQIATFLSVSLRTVESTRAKLRERLGLRTRAELTQFALTAGLINPKR